MFDFELLDLFQGVSAGFDPNEHHLTFVDGPSTAAGTVWSVPTYQVSDGHLSFGATVYANLDGGAPDMAIDVTLAGGATRLTASDFLL